MSITWIDTIEYHWRKFNEEAFDGQLQQPYFGVIRSAKTDGHYEHYPGRKKKGKIAISRVIFDDEDRMLGTLLHEMVHQWQFEVLGEDTSGHDDTFKKKARTLEQRYGLEIE